MIRNMHSIYFEIIESHDHNEFSNIYKKKCNL